MIGNIEIRQMARESGVPESTIEKDYALSWILNALSQHTDSIALKGGTGIRKIYVPNYRFSEDLDFTMLENISVSKIETLIKKAVNTAKKSSGINFHDEIRLKENINGYEASIYFRILRNSGNPLRIKFDLTKPDQEKIMLLLEKRPILHPYSDDCFGSVLIYSIQEIMSEKIRALFERTRPRDVYDVWNISKQYDVGQAIEIFRGKCEFKDVEPNIGHIIERKDDFANAWKNSLGHQLRDLPEFIPIFDEVIELLMRLKITMQ